MTPTLLTILYLFAAWSVISILAGMALSRILGRLQRPERVVPVTEWPDESLDALLAATDDPEFVESVLEDLAFLEQMPELWTEEER